MFDTQHASSAAAEADYDAQVALTRQAGRKHFGIVYERKLAAVLNRSQADSCVALVDLASGEHLQRVQPRSSLSPLKVTRCCS